MPVAPGTSDEFTALAFSNPTERSLVESFLRRDSLLTPGEAVKGQSLATFPARLFAALDATLRPAV